MLKLSNWEIIISICLLVLQKFINPLYILIPLIVHHLYKKNVNKDIIEKQNIDEIIKAHFKNTTINKIVYAVLLSDQNLIKLVKELEIFKNLDNGNYKDILYHLWSFLKIYAFTLKSKNINPDVLNDLLEKKNKLLNSVSNMDFILNENNSSQKANELKMSFQSNLDNYIRIIKNKFNLQDTSIRPANVLSDNTIF